MTNSFFWLTLRSLSLRFLRDKRAIIAPLAAVAFVPLTALMGFTIEYTSLVNARANLQKANDAAALTISRVVTPRNLNEMQNRAALIVSSMVTLETLSVSPLVYDTTKSTLTITSSGTYRMSLVTLPGLPTAINLQVVTKTIVDGGTYEIALVMDNSGSMASSYNNISKMASAKTSALDLINALMPTTASQERTKFSIVPFTLSVNIGSQYSNATWMDQEGNSSIHWQNFDRSDSWSPNNRFKLFSELNVAWRGCVESRPDPWMTNDSGPSVLYPDSYFVPHFAPDEPGNSGSSSYSYKTGTGNNAVTTNWSYPNSYLSDNPSTCTGAEITTVSQYDKAEKKVCKYRNKPSISTSSGRGPNYNCGSIPSLRLTNDKTALTNSINSMVASGNTNLLEGFMWGWRSLSPNEPFADGKSYLEQTNKKIIILLTDGMNVWGSSNNHNKSVYSPFGYYTNSRFGYSVTNSTNARTALDSKTLEACTNAKNSGITVYTIGYSIPNDPIDAAGLSLLQSCATANLAYVANDSSNLVAAFSAIGSSIGKMRISQ